MTTSRQDGGFGESPQTHFDVDAFDLSDPDLLDALDCVAQEPGSSAGHPPDSLEGRRAQLVYLEARIQEGLRDIEEGRVVRGAEAEAILLAFAEGRAPQMPAWLENEPKR